MKKLMTMIAAVATAFGLFADDPQTYDGTSFESAEGVTDLTWTPSSGYPAGVWSTAIEGALDLGAYATEGPAYTYASGEGATNTRRDGSVETEPRAFAGGTANANFLKLDTGSATVDRTVAEGQVFFDQVIKFTGFEDMQTNFVDGTKIALWTSAIEADEEEGIEADTNLYVAVGTGTGMTNVTIDVSLLDANFDFDAWHRVTIKNADVVSGNYLGFFVWIDGKMATIVSDEQEYFKGQVTDFKSYYDKGQLFISMDGTSAKAATVEKIGFQGVGSLDDVVVSKDGPAFAVLTVDVTFAELDAATIVKVVDSDDNEFTDFSKAISVKPGQLTVTLAAKPGWILKNATKIVDTKDAASGVITITLTEEDAVEAVAKIGATYFEKVEEALAAVEAAQKLDPKTPITVEFLKDCSDENRYYSFAAGTTLTAKKDGVMEIYGSAAATELSNVFGAMPEKQITVSFVDEDGTITLAGNIYGNGRVDTLINVVNGTATILKKSKLTIGDTLQVTDGAGAMLKAAKLTFGNNATIALVGKGKVMTKDNTLTDAQITVPAGEELDISGPDEDNYYTYQIKQAPTETGFAIIITDATPAVTNYFDTLEEAIAAAGTVVEDVQLPNVVTIMADNLGDGTMVTIEKEVTLDLNSFTLNRRIASLHDGKVTVKNGTLTSAEASTIYVDFGGAVTLADNAKVVNTYEAASNNGIAIAAYAGCTVTVGAGCEVSSKHYGIVVNNDDATYDRDTTLTVNGKVTAEDAFAICGNGNDTNGTDITIGATAEVESQNDIGIYFPNDGTLAINGGTVKGATAVYVKAGATTILTDANLIATGDKAAYTPYTNGANATGDALVIDNCGYPAGTLSIAVNGGKFTSASAAAVASYADTSKSLAPITGFISGGLFKGADGTDAALLAASEKPGYKAVWVAAEDGYVKPGEEAILVTEITLDKSAVVLYAGDTSNVVATITPADALVQTVTWDYTGLNSEFATAQVEGNTIKITGVKAQAEASSPMVIKAKVGAVEATCSISVIAVPTSGAKSETQGAEVEEEQLEGGKIAKVTTTDDKVKAVTISGLGETTTVQVNGQIDSITGVGAGNNIKVVSRGDANVDITSLCKIELNGNTVTISLDSAKAAPVIGEVTIDDKPVAPVSADGTVGFQTKPGLYYTLIAGNEPGAVTVEATDPTLATGEAMKLTADPAKFTPTGAKAFFKVDAAK